MLVNQRLGRVFAALCFLVAAATCAAARPDFDKSSPVESRNARIVQGQFDSKADQQSFQQALAKAFGGEVKIGNPGDGTADGDGAGSDDFGRSVALLGDTALVGVRADDVGANSDQGSVYVFTRSGTAWSLQTKLIASDGRSGDQFGQSVALASETALVGAVFDDNGAASDQGSAYVFTRNGAVWSEQAKLVAGDGAGGDQFGNSVALSGETALVGAVSDDNGAVLDQGSAYLFTRVGTTWSQQAKLAAGDGMASDVFGLSVALSGDTALVGAGYDDIGGNANQGSAYVFVRTGTTWSQQVKLTASDGGANDFFGEAVACSGDTVLVGALSDDIGASSDQGSAYVFTRSGTVWSQQTKLIAVDGDANDQFGDSVALVGDTALVGATLDDVGANFNQGSAYVFARSGTLWSQQAKLTAADALANDTFGNAVALSSDTALIGANTDDLGANVNQGSSYVLTRSGVVWSQQGKLTAGEGALGELFGDAVAICENTALVGAYFENVGTNVAQGAAYVFTRIGSVWSMQARLTAADGGSFDLFGVSVSLSGDTALVGAHADAIGANGSQGSAYVFARSGTTWSQQAKLVAADGGADDSLGISVSVAGDSAVLGSWRDDIGANANQGSAYVFTRSGTVWSQQAKLTAADGAANDSFGRSVALSGESILVGAISDTVGANVGQGSAYVFTHAAGVWSEQAKLVAVDGAASDQFGRSVSLSGDSALVSAFLDDTGANTDQGSAYVFARVGSSWSQQGKLLASDGSTADEFGFAVAIHGDNALVGAWRDNVGPNSDQGGAYLFARSGGVWSQQIKFETSDGAANDNFGASVALSSDTGLVGALSDDSTGAFGNPDVGSVYVYENRFAVTASAGPNGSLAPSAPQLIRHGQSTSFTVTPAFGYSVQGVSGCDGSWLGSNPYTTAAITADCTVTATFAINTYTLTYGAGANGSISGTSPQTVNHGASGSAVVAVADIGYHFVQWSDGLTSNPRSDANITANLSLTAQFAINQYTVSFDSQGGSAVASITQDFASTVTVPSAPTRTGYTFASWNTASDGNGTSYAPGATFAMPANNQTLFAIWTINQYTVSFDSQGGSAVASITQDFASTVTVPSTPTRTGYTFANWNTAADGNGTSYAPAATFAMPANNQILFAIWTINTYTLTYNAGANGSISGVSPQSVNFGSDGSAVTAVADAGYHFVDWSDGSTANPRADTNVAANLSVTANFGNDAPTIAIVNDVSVLEDSGAQTLLVTVADLETSAAALTLVASSAQPGLIAHPVVSSTAVPGERSLAFTATPNQNGGPVMITLTVTDSVGASSQRSFAITVTPVNDAPGFTLASIATHAAASSGVQTVNSFASVDFGPSDEDATQTVADFLIDSVTDADAILAPGSVDIAINGTLSYTLTGVGGSATISVRVRDDGGTGNAGQDTSSPQQFMINVTPGADLQVAKDNNRVGLRDGEVTVYAIVVANAGPNAVTGATLTDNLPGTLVNGSWACIQGLSTATCPQPDANTGNLGVNINLGVNQFLRFDVMATVSGNVGAFVNNTVTTAPPNGITALNTNNDSATDQDPIVPIGIFVDGFEASSRQPLTVVGAAAAMAND